MMVLSTWPWWIFHTPDISVFLAATLNHPFTPGTGPLPSLKLFGTLPKPCKSQALGTESLSPYHDFANCSMLHFSPRNSVNVFEIRVANW